MQSVWKSNSGLSQGLDAEQTSAPPKRLPHILLAVLVAYAVVRGVFAAAAKRLWYDELMTLVVSQQGTWKGIVAALRAPLDGQPPLSYMFEGLALKASQNQEIALRLPSILAFSCTLVCVFVFCRRRAGDVVGVACAAVLLTTRLSDYAVEARPYSMVFACIAFALVCYQRMPSKGWTVLFALALFLAQCLHYYAVFAMVPFGCAEVVYSLSAKKIRWPVWMALFFGCLPLAMFWPILSVFKAYYGAHNWTRVFTVPPQLAYGDYLGITGRAGEVVATVLSIALFAQFLRIFKRKGGDSEEKAQALGQISVYAGLLVLPLVGFAVTHITQTGLLPRYTLSTILGMVGALAIILGWAKPKLRFLVAVFVFCFVGLGEVRFWKSWATNLEGVKSYAATKEKFVEEKGYRDLTVAVPDGLAAVALMHYAGGSSFANRLVFLEQHPDPDNPQFFDTIDRELELYQRYSPLKVATFSEFAATHNSFLLYVEDNYGLGQALKYFSRDGWAIEPLASNGDTRLFLVSRNEQAL